MIFNCLLFISKGHTSRDSGGERECMLQWPCDDAPLPVCGSDGQTYLNLCVLRRAAGCVEAKRDLVVASNGKCSDEGSKYHLNRTIPKLILI